MRKYKTEIKKIKTKKLLEIRCNKCGKKEENLNASNIETFSHSFGYGSDRDGQFVEFDLCSNCFEEIVSDFKIKIKIHNNYGFKGHLL